MRRVALGALLSHWRRQPLQLLTLLAGLALATALWSAVQAINGEARRSYDTAASVLGQAAFPSLALPSGRMPTQVFVDLRRAGWRVSPALEGRIVIGDRRIGITGFDLVSAPPALLPASVGLDGEIGPVDLFTRPGVAFVAPETAARIDTAPGLPRLIPDRDVPPDRLLTDIAVAERLLGITGEIDRLLVLPGQPSHRRPLAEIAPDLRLTPASDADALARLTDSFHLNLTAFGLLSFAVGLFIVHGAIGLAFEQRRPMFRSLRALGVPLRDLLALLMVELLVLATAAGTAGVLLGYLIAGALLPDVAATLHGLYGASVSGSLAFDPGWAASGLAIALIGALVSSAGALNRVRRMPLLASAQPRAWAMVSRRDLLRQAAVGLGLLVAGAAAALVGEGLLAGFALLGGLLLGAALLLPLALAACLAAFASVARSPVSEWFWADTRQQLPGLSLALMALLLALATNIGVSTMVSSFRLTFTGWLDQRLVSQLYVTARDAAEGERLRAWLALRSDAILPIWSLELPIAGMAGEVYGIVDHAVYRRDWPMLEARPDAWDEVLHGGAILINEQLARRNGLSPGDRVRIGAGWEAEIAGIYSDYGNPVGQAIAGLPTLLVHHPEVPKLRHGVLTDAPDALATALVEEFGLPEGNLIRQDRLKAASLRVFERTFTVTAALNVLTLSVAGFAILTSLLTLSTMRLPQLAPVWALGLTRSRLARLEVLRSLVLAALTFAFALPVGLALAWCLLTVVNVEAFGWRLPMFLFPAQWIWLLGLAVLAALVASALPVRRLARTAPAQFLKVFADER